MQSNAEWIRRGMGDYAVMSEAQITAGLNQLRDHLKKVQQALGKDPARMPSPTKLTEQALAQLEQFRKQMEAIGAAGSQWRSSEARTASRVNMSRNGQQGQQGQQGQMAQQRPAGPAGRTAGWPARPAGPARWTARSARPTGTTGPARAAGAGWPARRPAGSGRPAGAGRPGRGWTASGGQYGGNNYGGNWDGGNLWDRGGAWGGPVNPQEFNRNYQATHAKPEATATADEGRSGHPARYPGI